MPPRLPLAFLAFLLLAPRSIAEVPAKPGAYIRENYTKASHKVPMRDGVHLYTIVYSPKDTSQKYPVLFNRTPYGIHPYEEDLFRASLGPNPHFLMEKYIFVYQDVRGRYLSEGTFENMRPHNPKRASKSDIDESTDTFDTIDWLVRHVPNHNGKVGMWGISYPGFYCSAGMIDAHPALKAVSPQAPIADWFFDDFFHHGAFFLPHAFRFFAAFGQPRPEPSTERAAAFEYPTNDGYKFYLDIGPLKNVNPRYFKDRVAYWKTMTEHPNYDDFWKARNILPHLKKVPPAVMTVGGWYDAEDLYGPLKTYQTVEKNNPKIFNVLVMGPWTHGGWSRNETKIGAFSFGPSAADFQEKVELPFFNHFLKGKGDHGLPEARMFETGLNRWRSFEHWPPRNLEKKAFYLHAKGKLSVEPPLDAEADDSFPSDPNRPVPFTASIATGMVNEYMVEDQRFASRRPDVLVYQTGVLQKPLTLAGPMTAELHVATSGTDSDWVVKLVDVKPNGVEALIRSEVIRGRFRKSYEKPEPFVPDQPAKITLELLDVLHTFQKGHRLAVQIHSTWFPLVDRNPQKFVPNIFLAAEDDFIRTTNRVFRSKARPSALHVGILKEK